MYLEFTWNAHRIHMELLPGYADYDVDNKPVIWPNGAVGILSNALDFFTSTAHVFTYPRHKGGKTGFRVFFFKFLDF